MLPNVKGYLHSQTGNILEQSLVCFKFQQNFALQHILSFPDLLPNLKLHWNWNNFYAFPSVCVSLFSTFYFHHSVALGKISLYFFFLKSYSSNGAHSIDSLSRWGVRKCSSSSSLINFFHLDFLLTLCVCVCVFGENSRSLLQHIHFSCHLLYLFSKGFMFLGYGACLWRRWWCSRRVASVFSFLRFLIKLR